MSLSGKRVLLGVSGGIAIYKTLELLSRLNRVGADTTVVMTRGAAEFVTPLAFQTMSRRHVYTDLFSDEDGFIPHIDLTREADLFLIAPATANVIAKMAQGLADDLLSSTALAAHCPVMVSPAMNVVMYQNPATQANLALLRERGIRVIEPESGWLACAEMGEGRMPEAAELFDVIEDFFTEKDLRGKRLLVTAGPTKERLDPVRFLTNDSSGKQGVAIAKRAKLRGADVCLVHGDVSVPLPKGIETRVVESTEDMLDALKQALPDADALIMAAAPADFKPVKRAEEKMKGLDDGRVRTFDVVDTPDILKSLSELVTDQIMIGFATETEHLMENAREKLTKKKLDYIVANDVTQQGAGFDVDTNIVTILGHEGERSYPKMSKEDVADRILDLLV
ncbi:MAG: bifunctional phosphopantothenoylcysteine decarboxylase/phosphopantothenate--cysteine ligase CoaBC [Peptoniphilaceae bacterium]|nr:bifunctional phosphopantothenoylcysteine decarboxylase/phosphopantothenate--cysteine ligase CoaBC [Peptoniphilaceae bacterium]MDY6085595.1 bifunctional phosphopantothenoylcysteine decarboxylase/phosphopantothenate--cysteine ligase CoaBC [Peptoniphilaceae bacterium]